MANRGALIVLTTGSQLARCDGYFCVDRNKTGRTSLAKTSAVLGFRDGDYWHGKRELFVPGFPCFT